MSIGRVIRVLTRRPYTLSSLSMLNTTIIVDVFKKLLDAEPTYANFYRRFIHPLTSRLIRRLASVRTQQERFVLFAPLKRFVANGLSEQRDQLVELGMYEKDDPENFLNDPDEIAERMVRAMIMNDYDLVSLLDHRYRLSVIRVRVRNS